MKRRITNQRGSPMRAALYWSILEEARISVEGHLNQDKRDEARPLRDAINAFLCKFHFFVKKHICKIFSSQFSNSRSPFYGSYCHTTDGNQPTLATR